MWGGGESSCQFSECFLLEILAVHPFYMSKADATRILELLPWGGGGRRGAEGPGRGGGGGVR